MQPDLEEQYNPADDDNQGVVQRMAQGEQASQGAEQAPQLSMTAHTEQEEPGNGPMNSSDTDANGVNDELLAEEDVESGDALTE